MHSTKVLVSLILLLSALLVFSFIGSSYLNQTSNSITQQIQAVELSSRANDWSKAKAQVENLEKQWEKSSNTWALLLDHMEIDNIDNSLTRMKEYIESEDKVMSLGELANLKQYVGHIPQKESFNFNNVF